MRYINPGYKDWLTIEASSSITEINDTSKTKTGIAFYNSYYNNYAQFDFPANGEIYCKFDFFYTAGQRCNIVVGESKAHANYNNLSMDVQGGNAAFSLYTKSKYTSDILPKIYYSSCGIKPNAVNSALFHLKWATENENGFIDFQINDYIFDRIESEDLVPYSTTQLRFLLYTYNYSPISNIIISDEPISIKEQVVAVPISNIATDMTYDSETGLYTASEANQSLFANLDVSNLVANFGSDSKVTGVAVVGNSAYRTAEGLSSFTALTKKNNTVTEHGAANVPADSSVVQATFKISDTTIADLGNMQLGLKVGG